MKLFTRYNRLNILFMVLLFLGASIAYYQVIRYVLVHELDESLGSTRKNIERYVKKHQSLPRHEDIENNYITFSGPSSQKIKSSVRLVNLYDEEEYKVHYFRQLRYSQKLGEDYYLVSIARPLEGINTLLRAIVSLTLSIILLTLLLSFLMNRLLLKKLWRPFYGIIDALRRFRISDQAAPDMPQTDIDEFVFLRNNLTGTIRAAQLEYHALKEFTENASHEIQTPLAIIRTKLELLIQEESLPEHQTTLLHHSYSAVTRLSRLNQSLLLLTKIENTQYAATTPISLKEKLEEKLTQLEEIYAGNHLRVHAVLEDAHIQANAELTDLLLNNLLSNAIKHNVEGGQIVVHLTPKSLLVENNGQPAALDETKIFRRFYKTAQHSSSNGLGLSIIKKICDQAGISITYTFRGDRHCFLLTFPTA